jgi:hypothetical protein
MRKKFKFSIQGCVILFACTTIPILHDQTLEFFYTSSTPSPFMLVATSLFFPNTSFHHKPKPFHSQPCLGKPFNPLFMKVVVSLFCGRSLPL